ncbi:hypothetical protein RQP46_009571 [Phenoliferia psychrophenolica]
MTTSNSTRPKRIVVAMTGATGAIYAVRLLQILRELEVETHLVLSHWAEETIKYETDYKPADVRKMADHSYNVSDQYAPISSGSFKHDGMIIVPCSMKTLAAVRVGYGDDLVARAADVCLKERRKLVLVARETPLSDIHLDNMLSLTRSGAIIFPPVPAFYTRPTSLDDIVNQSVGRMLDMFGLECEGLFERWSGAQKKSSSE